MSSVDLANLSLEERRRMVLSNFERARWAPQRVLYVILGVLFLGVGVAGFIIPGLPGTVFLLIAVWFFGQSNERLYRAMLSNRFIGRQLVDYKAGLGIPRMIKVIAVSCIVVFSLWSVVSVDRTWIAVGIVIVALAGVGFILTRPTRERLLA